MAITAVIDLSKPAITPIDSLVSAMRERVPRNMSKEFVSVTKLCKSDVVVTLEDYSLLLSLCTQGEGEEHYRPVLSKKQISLMVSRYSYLMDILESEGFSSLLETNTAE